ncbi:MAG: flagellar biosynthesis anti-sigma factor FlgM [Succinivibrio sp.]|nr:flagellar biosynthesis anti-sigma factor FlgM [Succinivibrio sp.]
MAIDILSDRSMNVVKDSVASSKLAAASNNGKAVETAKPQSGAEIRPDAVMLTDSAKNLAKATARARASEGVDSAKVEKLKQSIKDGNYKVDYHSVASKMIDAEDELSSIFG